MLVPDFLFGTAKDVRSNVAKVVTRLRRGATLEAICEAAGRVDLAEHPDSLAWIERAWVLRPSAANDYRAVLLTNCLFDSSRIPFERSNAIREESVEYLSASPWGTVILNSGQVAAWHMALPLRPLCPSRRGFVAILQGTLRHWTALSALGERYYAGGGSTDTFPGTLPAYGRVLARLGVDASTGDTAWKDIRDLCDESFIARLRSDDDFWNDFVRRARSQAGVLDGERSAYYLSVVEVLPWLAQCGRSRSSCPSS